MQHRQDIQILRGIAVLLVVLFHFEVPYFQNGFLGVDVFFVISGFLMAMLYNQGTVTDFYKRRIFRLLPAYAVTVIVTVIVGAFVLIPVDFNQLYDQAMAAVFFSSNAHYWNQNSYFDKAAFKPLLNLWSLGVEAQFYLIVPFLYPILHHRKWLLGLTIIGSFAACLVIQQVSPKTSFFITLFRVWEFLLGAYVAWNLNYTHSKVALMNYARIFALGALLVIFFAVPISPESRSMLWGHPAAFTLLICILTASILSIGLPKILERSFVGKGLAKLGDYSYSIYLVHFPIIVMWNYGAFSGTVLSASTMMDAVIMMALIIVTACALYHFVERNRAPIFKKIYIHVGLLAVIAVVSIMSVKLINYKYTDVQKNIFAAWEDRSVYRCGKVFRILNPTKDICRLTKTDNERKVFLIGNSHADSIKTKIAKAADRKNISVYFYVPNDPLQSSGLKATQVIEDIKDLGAQSIILHYNNLYDKEPFRDGLRQVIDYALANNINVDLIAPVPVYVASVPKTMYDKAFDKLQLNRTGHEKAIQSYRVFEKSLNSEVNMFDPAETLCPQMEACLYANQNKQPYYYDSAHLTLNGSDLLNPIFDKIMSKIK